MPSPEPRHYPFGLDADALVQLTSTCWRAHDGQWFLKAAARAGLAFAEVVVAVDGGDADASGAPLQRGEPFGHGARVAHERLAALELEVVDDVDEEERDRRVVGSVTMKLVRHARLRKAGAGNGGPR